MYSLLEVMANFFFTLLKNSPRILLLETQTTSVVARTRRGLDFSLTVKDSLVQESIFLCFVT